MRTLMFVAIGTRGDVQPIVVLGEALQAAGERVVIVAGANFQAWVERRGLTFYPLQADMEVMMRSPAGQAWADNAGKNPVIEGRAMRAMLAEYSDGITADLQRYAPEADALFSNLSTFGLIEALAEQARKPHLRVMFSPLTPTADPAATMVPAFPYGRSPLNRLAGHLGIYFTYWIAQDNIRRIRQRLGLAPWGWRDYTRAWNRVPALVGVSPLLLPPDPAWGERVAVTGYWLDAHPPAYTPPDDLRAFLDSGDAPVYVGFGSMPDGEPGRTTRDILTALERTGQRGIIQRGWAQLGAPDLPESVLLVDSVPHDWLFPRVKAAVHHGGAGTVAAALMAGVPSTIVPHLGDQPYWGRRLHELGAGAKPIKRLEFNADRLTRALEAMLASPDMRAQAAALGAHIRAETGVQNAVAYIQRMLR